MREAGQFKPSTSGNPGGKPGNLTAILRAAGDVEMLGGQKRSDFLAQKLWEYVTLGNTTLGDGTVIKICNGADWLFAVKFLYDRIDGKAMPEMPDRNIPVAVTLFRLTKKFGMINPCNLKLFVP